MLPEKDLLPLLPHRPPFIMIGVLLEADTHHTKTGYKVEKENLFVSNGKWREPGLLENMAQTVAAGAGYRAKNDAQPVQAGYIASVKRFEVVQLPDIGDQLITEVIIREAIAQMVVADATVKRGDTLIASCEMNIFIASQPSPNE